MVSEIAVSQTREGHADAFIGTYTSMANVLTAAEGSTSLHRGVEDPHSFALIVEWNPVEAHTSPARRPEFGSFGEACLAGQPGVRHVEAVA